ncbi:hydantoinase/oxoprolinase family protein [Mycolicibacterium sp. P9-64]|uniref:hydantoinase/oxoprolinase family protein n=1 Tax=Mycolicibacterium sp. P9-64 TaxID=2024612 RepID=UPI0011EF033E|nr:hydantoinase/oxoprolinase family protein [Mycolicibacterium sp. P9-64]KAA0085597.1 hydantoinase/oxoprolinase family protein [Mycolicibacterium sp. P9-64]
MLKIGIDVGGTFTDGLMVDESTGHIVTCKVPSTRDDPSIGVTRALEALMAQRDWAEVGFLAHATTVATNAVIEARGPKTALLTTRGFRDAIEIGRLSRPAALLYDYRSPMPPPLIPRRLRFEVTERLDASGEVLTAIDEDELRALAYQFKGAGVEAIAVCFLHSYANSAHERRAGEILTEILDDVAISLSSDVLPEAGEFERASTTAANAFLQPLMSRYLVALGERTAQARAHSGMQWHVMQSNGGMARIDHTRRYPVHTLISGPAAGVAGGAHLGRLLGLDRIITADMGGTSLDVALISDGVVEVTTAGEIAFRPVKVPMLDLETVGAGGGSIAWIDASGGLRIGPDSAGSTPGPACYGHGGQDATVSDADIVLGYLPPDGLLGDEIQLRRDLAEAACGRIGAQLGMDAVQAADAIVAIVNHTMSDAIATVSIRRGHEPQDFALCAFGGAGGMHAVAMAESLGIPWVVIPPTAGCFSALGLTVADLTHTYVQTLAGSGPVTDGSVRGALDVLSARAEDDLRSGGVAATDCEIREEVDARYVGQLETLTVPYTDSLEKTAHNFEAEYMRKYGYMRTGHAVELVNARVHAIGRMHREAVRADWTVAGRAGDDTGHRQRRVFFHDLGWMDTVIVDRSTLSSSTVVTGPAIVEQSDATTVVPPGYVAVTDETTKSLIIGRHAWKRSGNV